jgi:hypothetical protein
MAATNRQLISVNNMNYSTHLQRSHETEGCEPCESGEGGEG